MKQGVSLDESSEPEDFLLHFIDSKTTEKVKEQTNLHARQKVAKLRTYNKLNLSFEFRLQATVMIRNE
jgi:hypothetical protein